MKGDNRLLIRFQFKNMELADDGLSFFRILQ